MLSKLLSVAVVAAVVTSLGAFANPAYADPVQPTVSVGDTHVVEPTQSEATTAVDFVITLDRAATGPVFVAYRTRRGSAYGRGRDFYATSGLVGISRGQTSAHVHVRVRGDRHNEGVETFDLELTRAQGATLADSLGTATIEPPFALTLGHASVLEPNAGNYGAAEVVASLGAPMKVPVTFGWHTDAPPPASAPATPGNDYLP
ncbi:MAG: endoglucanase, partial [Actinomycetia bacterium]|nr:endoglucanase [Actinomycetes bacterium]